MSSSSSSSSSSQPPYPLHPSIIDRIDAQYAAFYDRHVAALQQVHLQPIAVSRASGVLVPGAGPLVPVGSTADLAVARAETPGPPVPVRCFTPPGPPPAAGWPALLYFHGGGWVLGGIATENVVATNICARARCLVVAADYRLAPENPFPAALDDAWELVLWALGPARLAVGLDPARLAVGGSSAGGNLAAAVCQRAVARAVSPALRLQLLSVPVLDNTADASNNPSWAENRHAPALPAAKMLWYRHHYLPDRADWARPEASPLLWEGDWSRLPPAVVVLGQCDVLRHEGQRYGEKLAAAGVDARVHVLAGQPHPFLAMDGVLDDGRRAITWFCEAMSSTMYPSTA